MSAAEWVVLAAGLAAIAWVNWYFFLSQSANDPHDSPHQGHQH